MTFGTGSPWSDQTVADLTRLYADGFSCKHIGEQIGLTRNAVIGKVHRLGLEQPADKKPVVRKGREVRPRIKRSSVTHKYTLSRLMRGANNKVGPESKLLVVETAAVKLRCVEVTPLNLTLADLPKDGCHYIPGDDLLYCGHKIKKGSSYCPDHDALCKEPSRPYAPKYFSERATSNGRRFSALKVGSAA